MDWLMHVVVMGPRVGVHLLERLLPGFYRSFQTPLFLSHEGIHQITHVSLHSYLEPCRHRHTEVCAYKRNHFIPIEHPRLASEPHHSIVALLNYGGAHIPLCCLAVGLCQPPSRPTGPSSWPQCRRRRLLMESQGPARSILDRLVVCDTTQGQKQAFARLPASSRAAANAIPSPSSCSFRTDSSMSSKTRGSTSSKFQLLLAA